ncbi:MAG: branched-chain amino acid ABC transporter permease [Rubrivivax sp.]
MTQHRLSSPWRNALHVGLLALVVLQLPLFAGKAYFLSTLVFVAIYALPAIGLSLLSGLCGQLAISHGAFFALGAFGSAVLSKSAGVSPIPASAIACAAVVLISFLIGRIVLRLRSHYLVIATLSFSIIVEVLLKEWSSVTGGQQGLDAIQHYRILGATLEGDAATAVAYWMMTLGVLWFSLNLSQSRIGRTLRAIRESEVAVGSVGLSAPRFKLMIYVVSSLFAGLGGAMYAHYVGFLSPSIGSIGFAMDIIMALALGGFDRLWGALVGVVAITLLNEYSLGFAEFKPIALGVTLVMVMLVFPEGLLPGLIGLVRRWIRPAPAPETHHREQTQC